MSWRYVKIAAVNLASEFQVVNGGAYRGVTIETDVGLFSHNITLCYRLVIEPHKSRTRSLTYLFQAPTYITSSEVRAAPRVEIPVLFPVTVPVIRDVPRKAVMSSSTTAGRLKIV